MEEHIDLHNSTLHNVWSSFRYMKVKFCDAVIAVQLTITVKSPTHAQKSKA